MQKENLSLLRQRVMSFMQERHYKKGSFINYNRTFNELANFMNERELTDYTENIGSQFLHFLFGDKSYNMLTVRQQLRFKHIDTLTQLLKFGEVTTRTSKSLYVFEGETGSPFRLFLKELELTRRNSATVRRSEIRLYELYRFWLSTDLEANTFGLQEGILYLKKLETELCIGGREEAITKIRAFLYFMCERKLLAENCIEKWMELFKHRFVKNAKIPSVYTPQEIESIISAIDRTTSRGKRDYAIILLAARYGLRNSDIIGLRFCNLDWENNKLCFVQQKTSKRVILPLSEEVGVAIIDYIRNSRPAVDLPYVFLSDKTPHNALSRSTIANALITWMQNAGVDFASRRHGPHALRHSLASNLLNNNVTLPVISEILGHTNTQVTTAYLRVSIDLLRQCALDVPFIPSSTYGILYEKVK